LGEDNGSYPGPFFVSEFSTTEFQAYGDSERLNVEERREAVSFRADAFTRQSNLQNLDSNCRFLSHLDVQIVLESARRRAVCKQQGVIIVANVTRRN
jgi:hypothetical protein